MVREEIVFGDDKCLCMRAYVEHRRVDTQQAQEQIVIGATKYRTGSACPWQANPTVRGIQQLRKNSIQTIRDSADVLRHIIKNVSSRLVGTI